MTRDSTPRLTTLDLTTLDLFSGCGGLAHALRDVARPVAYCEIDPVPRAMLESRMRSGDLPAAPVHPDVALLDGGDLRGKVRMIVGGFPCPGVSSTGLQRGFDHPGTALFWHVVRLAREIEPDFIFMENVAAIAEKRQGGRSALEVVVAAMHEAGYASQWLTVPAYQVGAPMQRYRWFCLCYRVRAASVRFHKWRPFDWSREPAGPRVVEPSPGVMRRIATLGNSVVPDCAALAFRALWTGLAVPLDELPGVEGPVDLREAVAASKPSRRGTPRFGLGGPDGQVLEASPPPGLAPKPPRAIPLDPRAYTPPEGYRGSPRRGEGVRGPVSVCAWPSPRYQNGWRGSKVLTWRGRGDLGTVVRFAVDDPGRYDPGRGRDGYTNPEFVEWLMGYPPGWTEAPGPPGPGTPGQGTPKPIRLRSPSPPS